MAPSWAQSDAQNRPFGAENVKIEISNCSQEPFWNQIFSKIVVKAFLAPSWSILDRFWMDFGNHFGDILMFRAMFFDVCLC